MVRSVARRILLIQLRYLGDVLLCTPSIRALRAAMPGAHLAFLAEPPGAEALRGNPHLDEILTLRRGVAPALALHRRVRAGSFDTVVDFRSTGTSARFTALSGASLRIGWRGRGPRNLAYTTLLERLTGSEYVGLQKARLLEPLGIPTDRVAANASLELPIEPADEAWAEAEWARLGLGAGPVIAISAVSRVSVKQWGAPRWAAVADALARDGFRILLTYGPGELTQAERVARSMKGSAAWDARPRSVHQLGALYRRCALWIGNDGGPKHVAAAVGTPTLSVTRCGLAGHWSDLRPGSRQWAIDRPREPEDREPCPRCGPPACRTVATPGSVAEWAREIARGLGTLPRVDAGAVEPGPAGADDPPDDA